MRNLIKTLLVSTLALGAYSAAQAADAIDEIPQAPEATEVLTQSSGWDGAYVGGTGTYQWGKVAKGHDYGAKGVGGGLYGGYNLQDGSLVYGAEADVNYSGIDKTIAGVKTEQGVNGTLRGRVGYDLNPALIYGTAGVAATNLTAKDATSEVSKTVYGVTVGGGLEAKITDTVTARTEYRYTNYADQTYGLASGAVDRGLDEHSVRVGLGVRF